MAGIYIMQNTIVGDKILRVRLEEVKKRKYNILKKRGKREKGLKNESFWVINLFFLFRGPYSLPKI